MTTIKDKLYTEVQTDLLEFQPAILSSIWTTSCVTNTWTVPHCILYSYCVYFIFKTLHCLLFIDVISFLLNPHSQFLAADGGNWLVSKFWPGRSHKVAYGGSPDTFCPPTSWKHQNKTLLKTFYLSKSSVTAETCSDCKVNKHVKYKPNNTLEWNQVPKSTVKNNTSWWKCGGKEKKKNRGKVKMIRI